MKKYYFTGKTKKYRGKILRQIVRLSDGRVGGWIENEENLSQEGNCFVFDNAMVFDDAMVLGNAIVGGSSIIYNDAIVGNNAEILDNVRVFDNAEVFDDVRVFDNVQIYDNARVYGNAVISDTAQICDNAMVYGNSEVYGNARVCNNARVFGSAKVYGYAEIYDNISIECGRIQISFRSFEVHKSSNSSLITAILTHEGKWLFNVGLYELISKDSLLYEIQNTKCINIDFTEGFEEFDEELHREFYLRILKIY